MSDHLFIRNIVICRAASVVWERYAFLGG